MTQKLFQRNLKNNVQVYFVCVLYCTLNTKKVFSSTIYSFSCKTRADIKNEVRHLKKCKKNNYKIELITKFTRLFISCGKLEKIL